MFRRNALEMRVLILAPIGRDAELLAQTLEELGIETATVPNAEMLLPMMSEEFGAVILADEAISAIHLQQIAQWLNTQPPWSDPPFVILTSSGRASTYTNHRAQEFSSLGNFTLIERPVRPETIVSAVRSALRGRMKQYEIRSRQESLLQANADLEQFAYSASHDLKEPLRSISIFSGLLFSEYGQTLDSRGLGFLKLVRDSSKRMDQLLTDLLAYSQASSISEELISSIPAANPLAQALENLKISILETGASVTVGALPTVRMRELHLAQLFQNLIGNAIKYCRDGVRPQICISSESLSGYSVFSVIDNGIGISHEYKESIFGIFKRLHANDKYTGTGIGLAICQRIVERYGGRIWVESEPGTGSKFFFTIPS